MSTHQSPAENSSGDQQLSDRVAALEKRCELLECQGTEHPEGNELISKYLADAAANIAQIKHRVAPGKQPPPKIGGNHQK